MKGFRVEGYSQVSVLDRSLYGTEVGMGLTGARRNRKACRILDER